MLKTVAGVGPESTEEDTMRGNYGVRYNYWWAGAGPGPNNYRNFPRHDASDNFWCAVISMLIGWAIITAIRIAFFVISFPFIVLYRLIKK